MSRLNFMTWWIKIVVVAGFVCFQDVSSLDDSASSSSAYDPKNDAALMVDWLVKDHRGRVSEQIEIRTVVSKYGTPEFAMFAKQDIAEGETLFYIPFSAMISSNRVSAKEKDNKDSDADDDEEKSDDQIERECRTVHYIVDEYLKGETSSKYFPYMRYSLDGYGKVFGKAINSWSKDGRKVFFDMLVGPELFPSKDWSEQFNLENDCEFEEVTPDDTDDEMTAKRKRKTLLKRAYYYFLAHSRGDSIIPLLDMIPHRNGNWTNVDARVMNKRAIVVYALRDIQKGEQLYASINECKDLGCDGAADVYMTQHMYSHRGFLEDYPRRWYFETEIANDEMDLFMDLDQIDGPNGEIELVVHWRNHPPDTFQINWIRAQTQRLQRMNETLRDQAAKLESPFERASILDFYKSFVEALEAAWTDRKGDSPSAIDAPATNDREYDSFLMSKNTAVIPYENFHVCTIHQLDLDGDSSHRDEIETDQSHYQFIGFSYDDTKDDTSLTLAGWLHTSSSSRSHYHEAFVHAPASFVKEVKRVIYIGGGDNLILHEIMKYKDLELVVGLELDQKVSRLSFKHFGSSPFFDDPRIQWWFGDASKTMMVLPEEYFGSFDLVLVDLLTFVADTVKVTNDMTMMEAATLLMKPDGGVISRNDDFSIRSYQDVTKYVVELEWRDLPFLCEQSVTFGSDSIDFIHTEPTDHGIKTLARPISLSHNQASESVEPFYAWNKYRQLLQQSCDADKTTTADDDIIADASANHIPPAGILIILEAENATLASKPIAEIQLKVKDIATQLGLSEKVLFVPQTNPATFVYVFEGGYIITRVVKEHNYIGFDLSMWDCFNDLHSIGRKLVEAAGGKYDTSTTSFNVVTSGILGTKNACQRNSLAQQARGSGQSTCRDTLIFEYDSPAKEWAVGEPAVFQEMLRALLPSGDKSTYTVAVICGFQDRACAGLEAATAWRPTDNEVIILPIYSCSSFNDMPSCEATTTKRFQDFVSTHKQLDSIILDAKMPLEMGQVIHKIFNETRNFDSLLEETILVLSPVSGSGETWRRELVDRFRTEMTLLDPAYRSDFLLSKGDQQHLWSVFSSIKDRFFYFLRQGLSSVIEKSSYESYSVLEVTNGIKNLLPDFVPSSAKTCDSDFDKTDAAKQWKSQTPVGYQSVIQFAPRLSKAPLERGELVLYESFSEDDAFNQAYELAEVVDKEEEDEDVYFVRGVGDDVTVQTVHRNAIRKFSGKDEDPSNYKVGDVILLDDENDGLFRNGVVTALTGEDGSKTDLYMLNFHKTLFHNVPKERLLLMEESAEFTQMPPPLQLAVLVQAFEYSLTQSLVLEDETDLSRESVTIGQGAIEIASWPGGHAVMKWDGATTVEVNLFLEKEDVVARNDFVALFREESPNLITTMLDEFPRGYGKVVNLEKEMKTQPLWLDKYDVKES